MDQSEWDKRYFTKLTYWFQENFAKSRVEYIREVGNVVHKDTVQKYNVSINKHYTMQTAKPMKKPVNNTLQNSYSVNPTQAPTVKERKVPVVGVIVAATVLVLAVVLLVKILGK